MDSIILSTATQLRDSLVRGILSPHDLLDALQARISEVDQQINALPVLCLDRARKQADELLKKPVEERGILCGLPVTIKDLTDVEGVPTTFGSKIFRENIPTRSAVITQKIEAQGGIIYAKSNTPEFGFGANTVNLLHGATRNPWDLSKSVAGSSGGAAASLASGTSWLSHGSDNGGSLRNPASFCSVVGFRPTFGTVARGPLAKNPYQTLSTDGPMARNVKDTALFLDTMTGFDASDPMSRPSPASSFLDVACRHRKPKKVAFSPDLGITPVSPNVARICENAAKKFEDMGVPVEFATPDFSGVHQSYQTLRNLEFSVSYRQLLKDRRDELSPVAIGAIERSLSVPQEDIEKAIATRAAIRQRAREFFEEYDLLLAPTTIVTPYPIEQPYVASCNGQNFENFVDWLAIAYVSTLISFPALSIPCGFSEDGLPVGLQIIAGPLQDANLLSAASLLEEHLDLGILPVTPAAPACAKKKA